MVRIAIGVACLLGSTLALGAPQRVLFVGNSYTAFNGPDSLEASYAKLHQERHPEDTQAVFRKYTIGGASLSQHLTPRKQAIESPSSTGLGPGASGPESDSIFPSRIGNGSSLAMLL